MAVPTGIGLGYRLDLGLTVTPRRSGAYFRVALLAVAFFAGAFLAGAFLAGAAFCAFIGSSTPTSLVAGWPTARVCDATLPSASWVSSTA